MARINKIAEEWRTLRSNPALYFDRSFSKGVLKQLTWLFVIMVIMYVFLIGLSYIHTLYTPGEEGSHGRWYDVLFLLIDPGSSSEAMSSPFVVLCAVLGLIVFSGMLISVISNVLKRRVDSYLKGETKYYFSDHVVVLGYNKGVPSLINKLHNDYPNSYIVVMCNRDIEEVRDFLFANLDDELENYIILMNGIRNAKDDLCRLRLNNNVKALYILGEENEPAHDAINMECLEKSSKLVEKGRLNCHVQFNSQTMLSALQKVEFEAAIKDKLKVLPFNFDEIWAQKALATIPNNGYKPLDGEGITISSDKHVHLIIVGTSSLGWSMAVNAAHILHFPNFVPGKLDTYSKITFIDTHASGLGKRFRMRYHNLFDVARWREVDALQSLDMNAQWIDPLADEDSTSPYKQHLGHVNFMDIQWEFIEGDIFETTVMKYLETAVSDAHSITTIALCMNDSGLNNGICLSLSEKIRKGVNEILVQQSESGMTINTLSRAKVYENIRAFGMMNECYSENLNSDEYGKLINACYCGCTLDGSEKDNIKCEDAWLNRSPLDRSSSNYCANMLFYKLRFLGLDTSKPLTRAEIEEATSEKNHDIIQTTEHNRWITERLLLGMRPLYKDEWDVWNAELKGKTKEEIKDEKDRQKELMRHVDICSNVQLAKCDPSTMKFDIKLNSKLWRLYEIATSASPTL